MLTPEGLVTILVAVLALLGTIATAISNQGKMTKDGAVKLEHRLTALEQNMFTQDDRKCLNKIEERVDNMMSTLAAMIPKNLKNPGHLDAILDTLSERADTAGWTAVIDYVKIDLSVEQRSELLVYLEGQSKSRSKQRRLWAGLYLGMLKLELDSDDTAVCEA